MTDRIPAAPCLYHCQHDDRVGWFERDAGSKTGWTYRCSVGCREPVPRTRTDTLAVTERGLEASND